jgi:hypothetical protein
MTMRTLFLTSTLALCVTLYGCAAPPQPVAVIPISTSSSSPTMELCVFEAAHYRMDGSEIPAGYFCPVFVQNGTSKSPSGATSGSATTPPINGCSYVDIYTKKDGTVVGPLVRCSSYTDAASYRAANAANEPAPCVTSYCGPVQVKGYYRKDGTYVRPHTRKK